MDNVDKLDDIDLFIITGKKRLWISRILALGFLSLLGQRRKKDEKGKKIAGKFCINILLEDDKLKQQHKDIFIAHELLQMKVLWQRGEVYSKYLAENEWAFKFLPNWIQDPRHPADLQSYRASSITALLRPGSGVNRSPSPPVTLLDNLARWLQLKIMREPQGMERITDGAVYFHPQDYRLMVLSEYRRKLGTSTT